MTTISSPFPRHSGQPWFWAIPIIVLLGIGVMLIYIHIPSAHPYDKHGPDAVRAQRCLKDHEAWKVLMEVDTRRLHLICVVTETEFFDLIISVIKYPGRDPEYFQASAYQVDRYATVSLYLAYLKNRTPGRCIEIDPTPYQGIPISFGP